MLRPWPLAMKRATKLAIMTLETGKRWAHLVEVDGRSVVLVLEEMVVPHTDFTKVTGMELVVSTCLTHRFQSDPKQRQSLDTLPFALYPLDYPDDMPFDP